MFSFDAVNGNKKDCAENEETDVFHAATSKKSKSNEPNEEQITLSCSAIHISSSITSICCKNK